MAVSVFGPVPSWTGDRTMDCKSANLGIFFHFLALGLAHWTKVIHLFIFALLCDSDSTLLLPSQLYLWLPLTVRLTLSLLLRISTLMLSLSLDSHLPNSDLRCLSPSWVVALSANILRRVASRSLNLQSW